MKKILVPCDFSDCAQSAVRFAIDLADANTARIILLTVLQTPVKAASNEDVQELTADRVKRNFQKLLEEFHSHKQLISHETHWGRIVPTILQQINEQKIDMVVMGSQGSRGWEDFFLGSNTEKVVKTSPIPVFSVKAQTAFASIKNIVVPCDFKLNKRDFISHIKELQKMFGAKIHLIRINTNAKTDDKKVYAELEKYARYYELIHTTLNTRFEENETDGIVNFAKEINADFIAMSTSGNSNSDHWYYNSIAGDVVNHTTKIVWTWRTKNTYANSM